MQSEYRRCRQHRTQIGAKLRGKRAAARPPALLPFVRGLLVISAVAGWALAERWRPPQNALCQTSSAPHSHNGLDLVG